MEITVHKEIIIGPPPGDDRCYLYNFPLWEIEIKAPYLDTNFYEALKNDNNFNSSPGHVGNRFRLNEDIVKYYIDDDKRQKLKESLLGIVCRYPNIRNTFRHSQDYYAENSMLFIEVFRDQPGYSMPPHIDNNHIMTQMIVNLVQDNETSTKFYFHTNYLKESDAVYQAPTKQNHGVLFLNAPGAIHSISGITKTRYILYTGIDTNRIAKNLLVKI